MSILLLAVAALPLLALLLMGRGTGLQPARIGAAAAGLAFLLAAVLAVRVATDGPVSAVVADGGGDAVLGLYANRLTVVLLLLVAGVSAIVQSFAGRYLHGDPRARRFAVATSVLTAATFVLVSSATLVGLAVAWTVAGIALCVLLGLNAQLPAARDGVRRTARSFAIGDGALWIGVLVALLTWGDLDLRTLGAQAADLTADDTALAAVALLIVVAALARSAQLPLQGWLPATLAAPTPVSALLHAGVVNAGGILLVRMSPLFGASAAATHLAFFAGAATTVYGTTLMLTKTDIKGALAHSTMGQMGFMVMTCGLGAFAAAIFHLVAHGMYKATLFLGSGAAVHTHVRERRTPSVAPLSDGRRLAFAVCAVLVPAAALLLGVEVLGLHVSAHGESAALLVFAWATGAWATWAWLRRRPSAAGLVAGGVAVFLVAPAYLLVLRAVTDFLAPALAGAGQDTVSPWWIALVLLVLAAASAIRLASPTSRLAALHRQLYVLALGAGHVVTHRVSTPGRRGLRLQPADALHPTIEGSRP